MEQEQEREARGKGNRNREPGNSGKDLKGKEQEIEGDIFIK